MNENLKTCLEKISKDPETAAKLKAIEDPDEAWELASSLQGGFTKEEFFSVMNELAAAAANADISNEDLQKFSGGGTTEIAVSGAASAVSGVFIAASAAI